MSAYVVIFLISRVVSHLLDNIVASYPAYREISRSIKMFTVSPTPSRSFLWKLGIIISLANVLVVHRAL